MGDEAQAVLEFATEEDRASALDALPEIPENVDKIDQIMKASLKERGEAAEKTADQTPVAQPKTVATAASLAVAPAATGEMVNLSKDDLTRLGFDTPGKLLKSYEEAQEALKRSQEFIKTKLQASQAQAAATTVQQQAAQVPATPATKAVVNKIDASKSRLEEIGALMAQLEKYDDAYSPEAIAAQRKLGSLQMQELNRLNTLVLQLNEENISAKTLANQAIEKTDSWYKEQDRIKGQEQAALALDKEFTEVDSFASNPKYPELKMSQPAREVEQQYLDWGRQVVSLYYGQEVNVGTSQGMIAMKFALDQLSKGAPDITEKCKVSGVPIAPPSEDIKKYLDVCELMDWRDGIRMNPLTGQKELVQRYHAPSGKHIPDTYPSLEAAYVVRMEKDGTFQKRIQENYRKGGEDVLKAIGKRDSRIVELDNTTGTSRADAGTEMSTEEAMSIVNTIDERTNDIKQLERLTKAMSVLGIN